jgi:hypothetical protein
MGIDKDSVNIVTIPGPDYLMTIDTTTGRLGRVLASNLSSSNLANTNLTQPAESRTYNGNSQSLTFNSGTTFAINYDNFALSSVDNMTSPNVLLGKTSSSDSVVRGITIADLRTALGIDTGSWTPTVTGVTNYNDFSLVLKGHYKRTLNYVQAWVTIGIDCVTTAETEVEFDLPVASDFGIASDIMGVASMLGATDSQRNNVVIMGNPTTNRARVLFLTNPTGGGSYTNNVLTVMIEYEVF